MEALEEAREGTIPQVIGVSKSNRCMHMVAEEKSLCYSRALVAYFFFNIVIDMAWCLSCMTFAFPLVRCFV